MQTSQSDNHLRNNFSLKQQSNISGETLSTSSRSCLARKKKYSGDPHFGTYIKRLRKKLRPDLTLSRLALSEIDDFITDFLQNFQFTLKTLGRINRHKTLSVRDLECATKLCLPPSLTRRVIDYGNEAVRSSKPKISVAEKNKKRRCKRTAKNNISFRLSIKKLKKKLISDVQLSPMALTVVDNFIGDITEQVFSQLKRLSRHTSQKTLNIAMLEKAFKLCLPQFIDLRTADYGHTALRTTYCNGLTERIVEENARNSDTP